MEELNTVLREVTITPEKKRQMSSLVDHHKKEPEQVTNRTLVTSVTPRWTPTDSEQDFGNGLNHYPHFTSFPFPISSRVLSQLLIHNLLSLLPYPHIVTAASAAELLPSINT
jgi:hypothetical protein